MSVGVKDVPFYPVGIIGAITGTLGILISCQGPQGPSGPDAPGIDTRPPTVVITSPPPLETVWDKIVVTASSVDNVAVVSLVLTIDGSPVGILTQPPYRWEIPGEQYSSGWHYLSARAYDGAGNIGESPPRMVKLLFSRDLSDTLYLHRFYNPSSPPPQRWALPDTARTQAFFIRFTPAKPCSLAYATLWLAGKVSDTLQVEISFWRGRLFPTFKETSSILYGREIDTAFTPHNIPFSLRGRSLRDDFFLVVALSNPASSDTLYVGADNGVPQWNRSGGRDDLGWFLLTERYQQPGNFMADLYLYYFPSTTP